MNISTFHIATLNLGIPAFHGYKNKKLNLQYLKNLPSYLKLSQAILLFFHLFLCSTVYKRLTEFRSNVFQNDPSNSQRVHIRTVFLVRCKSLLSGPNLDEKFNGLSDTAAPSPSHEILRKKYVVVKPLKKVWIGGSDILSPHFCWYWTLSQYSRLGLGY